MKETVKEVNVNVREDCLIWLVDTPAGEYAKNVDINIGAGCYVTVYINGRKYKPFATGSHELEWRAYEKNSGKITLVGANINGRFRVPFGLGGLEFTAADGGKSRIGVNGELVVKLRYDRSSDARYAYGDRVYNAFGCATRVTAADIRQKWIKTVRDAVRDVIVGKLSAYKTADELRAAFDGSIKPTIEKALRKAGESMSADGIEIDGCHISDLFIDNRAADKNETYARIADEEGPAPQPKEEGREAPTQIDGEPAVIPEESEREVAESDGREDLDIGEVGECDERPEEREECDTEYESDAADEEEESAPEEPASKPNGEIKECPGCRKPITSDGRFCKYCGYRLKI